MCFQQDGGSHNTSKFDFIAKTVFIGFRERSRMRRQSVNNSAINNQLQVMAEIKPEICASHRKLPQKDQDLPAGTWRPFE